MEEELGQKIIEIEQLAESRTDPARVRDLSRELLDALDASETPDQINTQHTELRCRALVTLSGGLIYCGQVREAVEPSKQCLNLALELHNETLEARAYNTCGTVCFLISDIPSALEFYTKCLEIWERLANKRGIATVVGNIGAAYAQIDNYDVALEYLQKALSAYEDIDDELGRASTLGNIGLMYWNKADYVRALDYLSQTHKIYLALSHKTRLAEVCANIGVVYADMGEYALALDYGAQALTIWEEVGYTIGVARTISNIGTVYSGLGDSKRALENYVRAQNLYEELGERAGVATTTGNIGNVYAHTEEFQKAIECYNKACSLYEALGDKEGAARNLGNIGAAYKCLSQYQLALEYLHRAVAVYEEIGDPSGLARNTLNIGTLYALPDFEGCDQKQAEQYLLRAIESFEALGMKHELYNAHKELAELYERQMRWEAVLHYKQYHQLEKTVQSEEAIKKMEQLENEKAVALRDRELASERAAAQATTDLLHKVLPSSIAERLINGEKIADYFQVISILFADIVGFTPIAARMPAKAVLAFLNEVFRQFDAIMEKHGCQKIKTIGDGYMAVCGAPIHCEDHAERLARAAIEMMEGLELPETIRTTLPKGSMFHLRIGMHTGSAFAGIVGDKGFVYDVYSDAVNLAARMESGGEAGRIHCSPDFAFHLQNRDDSFVFQERDEIEIKGKGAMRTYFLQHETM